MAARAPLPALTGLRFYAALLVVFDHFLSWFPSYLAPSEHRALYPLFDSGGAAVSLFFILSGFILAYNYLDGHSIGSWRAFYIARIARIYPAYLIGFLLAAAPYFWSAADPHVSALHTALVTLAMLQGWDGAASIPWNGPAWSLSVEAFFYLLFPFICIAWSRLSHRALVLSLPLLYAATFAGVVLLDHGALSYRVALTGPLLRLPEFVIGVSVGVLYLRGVLPTWLINGSPAIAGALLFGALILTNPLSHELRHNGILAPLIVYLILALTGGRGPVCRFLSAPAALTLGEASYALYITHSPVREWLAHYLPAAASPDTMTSLLVVYAGVAIGVSLITYFAIERPARTSIKYLATRSYRGGRTIPPS